MCIDPHAVAKIEVRTALEILERRFEAMAASDVEVSKAGLAQVARLKRLLVSCDSCYSRRRSEFVLRCVMRVLAEVVLRVIETSYCPLSATYRSPRLTYDGRRSNSPFAEVGWTLSSRACKAA